MISTSLILSSFAAGLVMFVAPCTLPIIPAYLLFISGMSGEGEVTRVMRRRLFLNAAAFTVGFSLVFMVLGMFASVLGAAVAPWRPILFRAAGILLIIFGAVLAGVRLPAISAEWHLRLPRFVTLGRPESSFLAGALFAFGWSPCIGPILGTILFLASGSSTALQGALLLGVFSLGLAVPFLLSAMFIGYASASFARFARASAIFYRIAGMALIALGALFVSGRTDLLLYFF